VHERLIAVDRLADALDQLRNAVSQPDANTPPDTLKTAQDLVSVAETTVTSARGLEDLYNLTIDARSCWISSPFNVTFSEGAEITLKVAPREGPEVAPLAFRSASELKATVMPDNLVRPALALSLLAAPHAKFAAYGAVKKDDAFQVAQIGTTDARFTYGLTLGMTWRGLDWRRGSTVALWLPELTINPVKEDRTFGIGGALSWRIFKFGAGRVWSRHKDLDGQKPGDVLPDSDSLRVRDAYGKGTLYFNIAVFGWPPFLPK